jgi:hypothetical protein
MTNAGGPSTPEGKAIVSMNATRHGLRAAALVIPGVESEHEWESFHEDVIDSLAPDGAVELALASRIAELMWRIRRVPHAERSFIAEEQRRIDTIEYRTDMTDAVEAKHPTEIDMKQITPKLMCYASALAHLPRVPPAPRRLPAEAPLQNLIRYEAHLNRQIVHTLHELEALQSRRSGQPSPLARIDVAHTVDSAE